MTDALDPTLGASPTFDRLPQIRADKEKLGNLMHGEQSQYMVVVDGRPVIHSNESRTEASVKWHRFETVRRWIEEACDWALLGKTNEDDQLYFAVFVRSLDLTETERDRALFAPAVDLRSLATQGLLTVHEQSLAGQAAALANWHATTKCCATCGARTQLGEAGWRRICTACTKVWFPRMDPAVIMLVTDGDRAVLAHEHRFPEQMFSTIAGFVEAGDTIDHAVRRETYEEIGANVSRVTYLGSQPWPFPHTLMIGCLAHVDTATSLITDPSEIKEARWFTRAELLQMHERTHPDGFWFPGKQSIAYELIMHFIKNT